MPNSSQFQPRSVFESLCMDLRANSTISTRIKPDDPENFQAIWNTSGNINDVDNILEFLPSPRMYQPSHLCSNLDAKTIEARNAYRAFFNRTIGPEARL
jgi:hypothetical protein